MYPNPVSNELSINDLEAGSQLLVYNGFGQLVLSNIVQKSNEIIDCTNWVLGIYFIKVVNNEKVKTSSFVKQ